MPHSAFRWDRSLGDAGEGQAVVVVAERLAQQPGRAGIDEETQDGLAEYLVVPLAVVANRDQPLGVVTVALPSLAKIASNRSPVAMPSGKNPEWAVVSVANSVSVTESTSGKPGRKCCKS